MPDSPEKMSKVLLIDDEEDVVEFFRQAFSHFRHVKFFSAVRARQGIEIATTEKPEVIMMDLRMPEMGGEDALRQLKPQLPGTKFVVMTGWDADQIKERIITEIGVDAYFEKPVDLERVITKVFELIMVR